jgi:hypothetical protein
MIITSLLFLSEIAFHERFHAHNQNIHNKRVFKSVVLILTKEKCFRIKIWMQNRGQIEVQLNSEIRLIDIENAVPTQC